MLNKVGRMEMWLMKYTHNKSNKDFIINSNCYKMENSNYGIIQVAVKRVNHQLYSPFKSKCHNKFHKMLNKKPYLRSLFK